MIWIRVFVPLIVGLMGIYYGMLILQCLTSWFKMTNREITFGRCLIPFYYWIAPTEEKKKETFSDYADEYEEQIKKNEKEDR
jgi:hypothetical protein